MENGKKIIKLGTTTVGQWGKAVIHNAVRKMLEIEEGDKVDWFLEEGRIFIKKSEQGSKPIEKRF